MASITKVTHTHSVTHTGPLNSNLPQSQRGGWCHSPVVARVTTKNPFVLLKTHTFFILSFSGSSEGTQIRPEREHMWFPLAEWTGEFIIHYLSHSSSTIDPMWTSVNCWRMKNSTVCQEVTSHLVRVANWKNNEAFGMLFSDFILLIACFFAILNIGLVTSFLNQQWTHGPKPEVVLLSNFYSVIEWYLYSYNTMKITPKNAEHPK